MWDLPWRKGPLVCIVVVSGFALLVYYFRRERWARYLLAIAVSTLLYRWFFVIVYNITGNSGILEYTALLSDPVLTIGFVFGLVQLRRDARALPLRPAAAAWVAWSAPVGATLAVVLGAVWQHERAGASGFNMAQLAQAMARPDGRPGRYADETNLKLAPFPAAAIHRDVESVLGRGALPVALSYSEQISAFIRLPVRRGRQLLRQRHESLAEAPRGVVGAGGHRSSRGVRRGRRPTRSSARSTCSTSSPQRPPTRLARHRRLYTAAVLAGVLHAVPRGQRDVGLCTPRRIGSPPHLSVLTGILVMWTTTNPTAAGGVARRPSAVRRCPAYSSSPQPPERSAWKRITGPIVATGAVLAEVGCRPFQAQGVHVRREHAGVDRRLCLAVGLAVRGRLRGADLCPRDGACRRAPSDGDPCDRTDSSFLLSGRSWRCAKHPSRPGTKRCLASPARCSVPLQRPGSGGGSGQNGSGLLRALAFTGFFLNLFNLIPMVPLDGGRAAAALHPSIWLLAACSAYRADALPPELHHPADPDPGRPGRNGAGSEGARRPSPAPTTRSRASSVRS